MEKEYIVGIDFGHGETSAWVVALEIETGTKEGSSLLLKRSNKSDRSYYSVIYKSSDNKYSLDDLTGNLIAGFKEKISVLNKDIEKKEAYKAYIQAIYKRLLDLNPCLKIDNNGETNFYLCIACPTKWNQEDKCSYIDFFNSALGKYNIEVMWVINESDAAYFTHGSIDEYKDKCVLIIDYGSSTIDYTVVYQGKKISDDNWSNRLGASNIEYAILQESKNDNDEFQTKIRNTQSKLKELHIENVDIYSSLLFAIRKAKEKSVTEDCYPQIEVNYNLITEKTSIGNSLSPSERKNYKFEIECNLDEIDAFIEYKKRVVEDLKTLNEKIKEKTGGKSIDVVILSGGACQMPWVEKVVKEIFKPTNIEIDNQASFVVAKGIAMYAKKQIKALDNYIDKIKEIDYSSMYIQADTKATAKAITTMIPTMVENLKSKPSMTGIEIRKSFCNFVKSLNSNNHAYCNLVQEEFNSLISTSVGKEVSSVILSAFNFKVDTTDTKLHIPVNVIDWAPEIFEPGGTFYQAFTNWIDNSSGRFSFTWDKSRINPELSKIINGTAKVLEDLVHNSEQFAIYPPEILKKYSEDIKNEVLDIAARYFYDKQLFNTTFKSK